MQVKKTPKQTSVWIMAVLRTKAMAAKTDQCYPHRHVFSEPLSTDAKACVFGKVHIRRLKIKNTSHFNSSLC